MSEKNDRTDRRAVLKSIGAAAITGGALSSPASASTSCSPTTLPVPEDTDFRVYLWASEDQDHLIDNGALDTVASHLEDEFGKVDAFNLTAEVNGTVSPDTLEWWSSDPDSPYISFVDYVRQSVYTGSFHKQGAIDILYYDSSNWANTPSGRAVTSGAYDGASTNGALNPWPVAVASADDKDLTGLKCVALHELSHLFMAEGPDKYGSKQCDETILDVYGCEELPSITIRFIEWAYKFGLVRVNEPDAVYCCHKGEKLPCNCR